MGNNNSAQDDTDKPNPKATTNGNTSASASARSVYGRTGIDPMLQWEIDRLNQHVNGSGYHCNTFHSDTLNMPYMPNEAYGATRTQLPYESRNPYYNLKQEYPQGCSQHRYPQSYAQQSYAHGLDPNSMFEQQGPNRPKGTSNGSEQCSYKIGTSDNLNYVELIVCKDDQQKFVEKYAVHNKKPNHKCGPNCPVCILLSSDKHSPTSDRASDIPAYYGMVGGDIRPIYSDTSDFDSQFTSGDLFSTTSESLDMAKMRKDFVQTGESQYGGADDDMGSTDSFSSDMGSDDAGSDDEETEIDLDDADLEDVIEEDDQKQMENAGFKPDSRDTYTPDDSDASSEAEIDIDTEADVGDVDDIGTSEMRRVVGSRFKIFESLTSSDAYFNGRNDASDDDGVYEDDTLDGDTTTSDEDSITAQVRYAMARVKYTGSSSRAGYQTNARKNAYKSGPFDSEDKAILGLRTDSDSYMNRPVKLSQKYN